MGDKLKTLFILHVEKVVLALAVALVGFFIWNGMGKTTYTRLPTELVSNVDRADTNVKSGSTWDQVREQESRDPNRDFLADARTGRLPTPASPYETPVPLAPITRRPVIKRQDPQLLAATSLEVSAAIGPAAYTKRPNQVDPVADLPDADPLPEKKVRRPKERDKGDRRRSGGGEGGFPRSGFGGRGGGEGEGDGDAGAGMLGGFSPPGDEDGDDEEGGMLGSTTPSKGPRKLPAAFGEYHPGAPTSSAGSFMGGFMMSGRGGMMMGGDDDEDEDGGEPGSGPATATSNLIAGNANVVAVQALVPFRAQSEAFEEALENTLGWDRALDRLRYLGFSVERADVTDDPTGEPQWDPNWKWNSWQAKARYEQLFEKRQAPEFANPAYLLTELSMPIPPLMWRKLESLALHSGIPSVIQVDKAEDKDTQKAEDEKDEEGPGEFPPAFNRGGNTGMGGLMSGMGGMGGRFPMSGMGGNFGGSDDEDEEQGDEETGGGFMMSGMGGMGGMMGMTGSRRETISEHKLIRFFDLTAKPGRKYRYRIQLFVQDPNSPIVRKIPQRGLEPEVIERLAAVAKQPNGDKVYWRTTEWSEPSPVVELPVMDRLYVGPAEGYDSVSTVTNQIGKEVLTRVPAVSAVGVSWDPKLAVDIPLDLADPETKLAEMGAVFAAAQGTFEIAHPINLTIKKLENHNVQSSLMLLDVRGGELVGGTREEPLYNPAAALALDANGNLFISDELSDLDHFRAFTFAEETETAAAPGAGGEAGEGGFGGILGSSGGGDGGAGMGVPGMPGGGEPGGRRGRRGRDE